LIPGKAGRISVELHLHSETTFTAKENVMGIRKNQKNLTKAEWKALISAIDAMHETGAYAPAYRRFVTLHVNAMSMTHMDWSVHTMRMGGALMRGKNFLAEQTQGSRLNSVHV
jgi:hypothetical protein